MEMIVDNRVPLGSEVAVGLRVCVSVNTYGWVHDATRFSPVCLKPRGAGTVKGISLSVWYPLAEKALCWGNFWTQNRRSPGKRIY